MIWSLYVKLGPNRNRLTCPGMNFSDEAWEKTVDAAVENGFNMIVLEINEGIHFASYPELARPDAWTRERVRYEVKRLKKKGIALIPMLQFSAGHHDWLGDYRRMMGLPKYYEVCRNLIYEVYDLFDKPEYIHLCMDEEGDPIFFYRMELVAYRQGELLWHDLQFLCDCVRDKGATPWIWGDLALMYPEEFKKRIKPGSVVLSPWNYRGLKPEHYTPIAGSIYEETYKGTGYTYVEEDPLCVRFMERSVPTAQAGFDLIPCSSICWCKYNPEDMVEYFCQNMPSERLAGFMVAPWTPHTDMESIDEIVENIRALKAARDKFCK